MTPRASKKALDAIENPDAHPDVWDKVREGIRTGRVKLVQEEEAAENNSQPEPVPSEAWPHIIGTSQN